MDIEWQHKRRWGRLRGPRLEFSFLVNRLIDLGIGLPGDEVDELVKVDALYLLLCALDAP